MRRARPLRALATWIAAAALFAALAGTSGAAVITFDDLGVPAGGRVTVNAQYSAQGVTFNDVTAIDYAPPSFAPGFAHSGTVGVEQCFAAEFCSAPIIASFTTGQQHVRLWVGASFPLAQPLGVQLTAFDANHSALGSASLTLPASTSPTPISQPLEVTAPNGRIRSVELSVPGGYTGGVAVDDLEFTAAGPAPPCAATASPAVDLVSPAKGLVVQTNEFLLQGSVTTGGAPIQSASIVATAQGQRTASLYPALVDADGGTFGPVRFNGLLAPGENRIVVTATNCRGTGTTGEVDVTWNPIPPGASFRLLGLEVTQGIQSASNTVPLVAATGTSSKRTFVRVYLGLSGATRVTQVSGTLTASRPDGSLPGGPPTIPSLNSIAVDASTTLETARSSLATSLNFELPREWLTAGLLHLQLDHLDIEGARSTLPCVGCDNPGPSGPGGPTGPAVVRFHTVPPLRITLVGVPYMTGSPPRQVTPRQLDFDMLASWLRRTYPSADIQISQMSLAPLANPPASCDDVNEALSQFVAMQPAQDPRTRFYGLIPDDAGFVGGCSGIPSGPNQGNHFGSGPAGRVFPEANPWDLDGSYADAYGGHEIAHMFGRRHPGFCAGQDRADPSYPFSGGFLGTSVFDFQGFDAGDAGLGLPLAVYDWRASWTDVMTYCHNQWMSDYTYRAILQMACAEDLANCPEHALFGARAQVAAARPRRVRGRALSITGTLTPSTGKVALDPIWSLPSLAPTAPSPDSPYAIELRASGGRALARYGFEPRERSDPAPGEAATALVHAVVPFARGTREIAVVHETETLAAVAVSAHAPSVRLLSPNRGKLAGKSVTVRWRARDRDRNRLTFTVLYSPDGKRYTPLAIGLRRTSLRVDLASLPGGSRARFQVLASDGVLTGSDRSNGALSVPVNAPQVSIVAPSRGAELTAGQPVVLSGSATDLQDGPLAGSQLAWSSSRQGALGSGATLTATLQPGKHVITLRATNRAGKSATASVTVTVQRAAPLVAASIVSRATIGR